MKSTAGEGLLTALQVGLAAAYDQYYIVEQTSPEVLDFWPRTNGWEQGLGRSLV